MTQKPLQDKVVLITGASQGVGEAVALAYAAAGATVILVGRHQRKLEAVYDKIMAAGGPEPYAITFDLLPAQEKEFNQLAEAIFQATGRLDGLVHCASYFYALSPLANQTIDEWMNQYRINTVAPMALSRAVLPLLQRSEDASVIFVGESHGDDPKAYWGGFGASKAGVNYLGMVAADEWSGKGNIRVNVLVPGQVNSPQRLKTHPGETAGERKDLADITPSFVYWMSPESKGKNGEIVKL
ncbi:MAG: SDR family oxidoreductase [Neisseriaceae bacterium]|nr:SDR family oxidoreductase [Neisseriaceae bacterium]MBP6863279.1 SDR family oxidoreductase [Neisseriaceae bacterium]